MRRGTAAAAAPLRPSSTDFSLCSFASDSVQRGKRTGEPDKWLAAAPASHFFLLVREWNVPDLLAFVLELLWDLAIKFLVSELLQWFQELWNGIAGKL